MKIIDIKNTTEIAHSLFTVICDNTFASPYNQRPLSLGQIWLLVLLQNIWVVTQISLGVDSN